MVEQQRDGIGLPLGESDPSAGEPILATTQYLRLIRLSFDMLGVSVLNGLTWENRSGSRWGRFHLKTYRVHDAGNVSRL